MELSRKREEEEYTPKAFRKDKKIEDNKEISKRKKKKTKKQKKKSKKKLKKMIVVILFIIILITAISLGISAHQWKTLAKQMLKNQNSIVVDIDKKQIAKLGCEKKNETIAGSSIPTNLKKAYVAIEDERFYSHKGIDLKRTGGAILSYITHFGKSSYGGSTITQQLVKNLTGDSTDSITRKVKEWWKAWQLETCLSKDEILEAYLNIIYIGPNMYGVETGAQYYFSKSAKDLTLEECAFLAGMNHSPNSYNPFQEKENEEKILKRTKTVLSKMLELNYINEPDYNTAIENTEKGLKFKKGEIKSEEAVYSYHTDALILEITTDLAKKYHISENFATNYINMAGLTIYSVQDSKIQEKTEKEFEKSKYILPSKIGGNSSQGAMVIIDHKTGFVVSCTGGLGKKTKARSLNRATQSIRQTGSAIKPLSVLIPAIDKKIITASSIYDDTERDFAEGYHPTDYNPSLGKVTVRRSVESSQNIPFVEIMETLKPKNSIKYMEKMGISTLTPEDESLVLALGGLQKGISPLEMASAYAMIANDGEYIEPTFYSKIENEANQIILKTKQKKRRVVSKEVAYIVKNILTQPVIGANGTATYCKIDGVDVAAKTGTTDDNYDRWLCGFTPYYTASTWYGYDENESIDYNKRNPAGLLWANVMARIHTGLNSSKFEKPSRIASDTICAETGKKATTGCKNTYVEYFLWNTIPDLCQQHTGSALNENTKNTTPQQKVEEIIKGITDDIDAEDPQEVLPKKEENRSTSTNTQQNNLSTNTTNHLNNNVTNQINTNRTNTNKNTTNSQKNNLNTNHSTITNTNNNNKINSNTNIHNTNDTT
ncbi:MAG: hypothetical protein HFJ33_04270 [Clostridia bacterium]|nr:hypothetical protein [Clostridia bacterium]